MIFIDADTGEEYRDVDVDLSVEELDAILSIYRDNESKAETARDKRHVFCTGDGVRKKQSRVIVVEDRGESVIDLSDLNPRIP